MDLARLNRWIAVLAATLAAQAAAQPAGARLPIADNSFLMEEAYNQDAGVIQHISLFQKARDGQAWFYAFTQEWPVGGQRNQFSYAVPFAWITSRRSGVGDVMLNWRYQAIGRDDDATWVAPRLSLVLPTGDSRHGLGSGVLGVQGAIPMSHRWTEAIVSHTNVGVTLLPGMKDPLGKTGTATTLSLGQSFIWQPFARTNFMLEAVWAGTSRTVGSVDSWYASLYLSPGVRWAYDFTSGLQIVPGVAFPIGVGPSKDDNQVLLYLSFEHPLSRRQ
jgi:hypothetical protein